jgi:hypothetical protein
MTAPDPRPDIRLLADLDAGLLDEARAREVRAAAAADPAAQAVLDALAATRAELAALPDPPVPPALAARWSAALAAEQALGPAEHPSTTTPAATPVSPPPPAPAAPPDTAQPTSHPERPVRTPPTGCEETEGVRSADAAASRSCLGAARRLLRRPAVLAAALLVAVAVVAALHARPEPPAPPAVGRPQLVAEAVSAVGVHDAAGLDDPTRRAGCLRAVGRLTDAPLLGGRRVTFEGNPGVLLVLGTGQRGTFDVLIVDPDCGPERGTLLDAAHVAPP